MEGADPKQRRGSDDGNKERPDAATSARISGIAAHPDVEHGERLQHHQQPLVRARSVHAAGLRHIAEVIAPRSSSRLRGSLSPAYAESLQKLITANLARLSAVSISHRVRVHSAGQAASVIT